jgi:cupin fold WbuC family metalloprotein
MLIPIDNAILDRTAAQAETSPRRRMIHRYHEHLDAVQRMLNAIEPDSYIMPHKHEDPDKVEVFIALRGRALVASFTGTGEVTGCVEISPNGPNYGTEIPPRTWHAILALEPGTVLYEVLEGPYQEITHKTFGTTFAPAAEATAEGLAWLRSKLAAYL